MGSSAQCLSHNESFYEKVFLAERSILTVIPAKAGIQSMLAFPGFPLSRE
jgi:hypothetical protein